MSEIARLRASEDVLTDLDAIEELLNWLVTSGRLRPVTLHEALRRTQRLRKNIEALQKYARSGEFQQVIKS